MNRTSLPVAIIGGGPTGLAAAAHLLERGMQPLILERSTQIAGNVREWAHVRFFSPWQYCVDRAAARLLEQTAWQQPDPDAHPTGAELIDLYLQPLAQQLNSWIQTDAEVTSITRVGFDKMKSPGRDDAPFVLSVRDASGEEATILARAVIDTSGTWTRPNWIGASGVPAAGERAARDVIAYGIPDVLNRDRERYANRRVLVLGSGHSAFNVLLDLTRLMESAPETSITWAVRKGRTRLGTLFGGGVSDALPARGELGTRVRRLVQSGALRLVTDFRATAVQLSAEGVSVESDATHLGPFDEIIAATGFRPDLEILSELRLSLDSAVESPTALAPLIDPNVHSCGSVPPHGAEELRQPETDFYIAGMKSYGRAPTFLLLTGYEQVRSIAAALAGDWDAARKVELVLPETGVCSSNGDTGCCGPEAAVPEVVSCCGSEQTAESGGESCCGSAPQLIQIGTPKPSRELVK